MYSVHSPGGNPVPIKWSHSQGLSNEVEWPMEGSGKKEQERFEGERMHKQGWADIRGVHSPGGNPVAI